jgi:PIN domain nuclease of toxin-antitoxin system
MAAGPAARLNAPMLLLDTHVLIWWANGEGLGEATQALIAGALARREIAISAVNAWKIATLEAKGRMRFLPDAAGWWRAVAAAPGLVTLDIAADVALHSQTLPGPFHPDPADRFLVAMARTSGMTLLTRDRLILDYAAQGHVSAIAA